MPELSRVIPGKPSAYLNEGDPWEPKWQQVFYGENYDRLRSIKLSSMPGRRRAVRRGLRELTGDFAERDERSSSVSASK